MEKTRWWHKPVDRSAAWMVRWLRSRWAFIQVTVGTILWIPLVVTGIDNHGFLYLYIATALSIITQVPLAMIGYQAMQKASGAEERTTMALEAILATMKAMQSMVEAMRHELVEQDEILEEIHSTLSPEDDELRHEAR